MVNKTVYNYLNRYWRFYHINDLRRKVLSKGYPREILEEAVRALESKVRGPLVPQVEIEELRGAVRAGEFRGAEPRREFRGIEPRREIGRIREAAEEYREAGEYRGIGEEAQRYEGEGEIGLEQKAVEREEVPEIRERGFRGMRFSGIIGLVLMILSLTAIVFFYLISSGYITSFNIWNPSTSNRIIFSSCIFLFSFLFIIMAFGFAKMGRNVESMLIEFSSGFFIALVVLFLILHLISFLISDEPLLKVLNTGFIILFILFFVSFILFFTGIMALGKTVKFAISFGIAGWILILTITVMISFVFYKTGFPSSSFSFQDIFSGDMGKSTIIFSFVIGLIGIFNLLFGALVLFSSSKDFE